MDAMDSSRELASRIHGTRRLLDSLLQLFV